MTSPAPQTRRKLIEVSIPLEKINEQSAREKSIRHGHPSTLHLWWSRKPTSTARAVLFAQIVDDPGSRPDLFPTVEEQDAERRELFEIIEQISNWDTVKNDPEGWFDKAREKIMLYTDGNPPAVADPFAGGGSIPLEAQRLGLEAHASDVNPVAVLLEKALIEIPPKFAGQPPVFPGAAEVLDSNDSSAWPGATGLAEDVKRYGEWMLEEAKKRIGHLYPDVELPDGTKAPVIAWLWARTVTCPNPACGIDAPLTSSWWVSKKKGNEAYIVPRVKNRDITYEIHHDAGQDAKIDLDGTVNRSGAKCIACGNSIPFSYIRSAGTEDRIHKQMICTISKGSKGKQFTPPTKNQEVSARLEVPAGIPHGSIFDWPGRINVYRYGFTDFSQLFTERQLYALTTLSDLVEEVHTSVKSIATDEYANAIATMLAISVDRCADRSSSFCSWDRSRDSIRNTFALQALPMIWDFAEAFPLSDSSGGFRSHINWVSSSTRMAPASNQGSAVLEDAVNQDLTRKILSTDPPYYDYIGYSDLSDFFYVWLRRSLREVYPELFNRSLSPKMPELVANPYRRGGRKEAQDFFESGFFQFFSNARAQASCNFPATVYYAFKQQEKKNTSSTSSSGWETILEGIIRSGWQITATWPMRSELANRSGAQKANSIASTIALVLRPRPEDAPTITRRDFLRELKTELPGALRDLQRGTVAPVDLPQSAIGPGIGLFSKYSGVLENDGKKMTVRSALQVINEILDEVLSEQEGDYDADTRFALAWFDNCGFGTEVYGHADSLARARNTSVDHLHRAGILHSGQGKVHLYSPKELHDVDTARGENYNPAEDDETSAWETVIHLAKALEYEDGVESAGRLLALVPASIDRDLCKQLAFLLFQISERRGEAKTALVFNQLGTAWNDIEQAARHAPGPDENSDNTDRTGTSALF
jgi:putative DNA methylase